jgi:hypothetical protein
MFSTPIPFALSLSKGERRVSATGPWFVWLNETNQMNKTNQMNQINPRAAR